MVARIVDESLRCKRCKGTGETLKELGFSVFESDESGAPVVGGR